MEVEQHNRRKGDCSCRSSENILNLIDNIEVRVKSLSVDLKKAQEKITVLEVKSRSIHDLKRTAFRILKLAQAGIGLIALVAYDYWKSGWNK